MAWRTARGGHRHGRRLRAGDAARAAIADSQFPRRLPAAGDQHGTDRDRDGAAQRPPGRRRRCRCDQRSWAIAGDRPRHLCDRDVNEMAQNIYDNDGFFSGYAQLPRSQKGLDGAPEWPSLRAMLPGLHGRKVLDLGCGYGWFCRWAREQGAAEVAGLDVSEKMLARAREDTPDAAVAYALADLDVAELPAASFDLIYSSLAFHYIADLERLLRQIHGALTSGGSLVFSAEHPIYT